MKFQINFKDKTRNIMTENYAAFQCPEGRLWESGMCDMVGIRWGKVIKSSETTQSFRVFNFRDLETFKDSYLESHIEYNTFMKSHSVEDRDWYALRK